MKNIILLTFLFLFQFGFSQAYRKELGKRSCECFNSIDKTNKTPKVLQAELGLCMLKYAKDYRKEIMQEYDIDVERDIADPEKMTNLGKYIGIMMLGECESVFLNQAAVFEEKSIEETNMSLLSGTIAKIEKGNFVVFHLVGDNKILTKFYWVTPIQSDVDLIKGYTMLVKKKVNVSYYTAEIFDASINDYKNVNILDSLKLDE